MEIVSHEQFIKEDYFLKELMEAIETEKLDKAETIAILRFLGSFAVNLRKMQLSELSDLFTKRVDAFVYYIRTQGYKYGKFSCGGKTPGIDTLISQAFYDLIQDDK